MTRTRILAAAAGTALLIVLVNTGSAEATASGCTARSGPGDQNLTCIDVVGTGLHVDQIRGSMISLNGTSVPSFLDRVGVEVTGTLYGGGPYSARGQAQESYTGSAWVDFSPNADFAPNSQVCVRTTYQGETGDPACETIYPG